ncbi:unnamed protein product [Gadus morhua 'NCC']
MYKYDLLQNLEHPSYKALTLFGICGFDIGRPCYATSRYTVQHPSLVVAGRNRFPFPQPTCRQSPIYVSYFSRGSPICRRQFAVHF